MLGCTCILIQTSLNFCSIATGGEATSLFPYVVPEGESHEEGSGDLQMREKRRKALHETSSSHAVDKSKSVDTIRAVDNGKGAATSPTLMVIGPQLSTKRRMKTGILKICPDRGPLNEVLNNKNWVTPKMRCITTLPLDEAVERIDAFVSLRSFIQFICCLMFVSWLL